MNNKRRVLVIGATQGTGLEVVNQLLAAGETVRVMARNTENANAVFAGKRVEIISGDITRPETLTAALHGSDGLIYTVGVTKRPAREALVKATDYDGVVNVLNAARQVGFAGRFVYLTTIGVGVPSVMGSLLNLVKRNTMVWTGRALAEIRRSGLPYTIVGAGVLNNQPAGTHSIRIDQSRLPTSLAYKISRADVARVLVQALDDPHTSNTTFNIYWAKASQTAPITFSTLSQDRILSS